MRSLLSEVDAAVWERSRLRHFWEAIIQKYFDERLCSGISEWPLQHFRCCGMRSVHWLVRFCGPIAQSHMTFLMRLEEFIRKMHFHLPLFTLTLFRTSQEPPQVSVKTFVCESRDFYSKFGVSHATLGWWKHSICLTDRKWGECLF